MTTREQGDLGEQSAVEWLWSQGAAVYIPFGHAPDVDLIALLDGRPVRVQVKTSTHFAKRRWVVMVSTRGGNQSWTGVVRRFSAERCDRLFVLTGDGRRWWIPAGVVGEHGLLLGGPKFAAYEVEPGRPILVPVAA